MQKRGSCYQAKAVVFCFCPELLPDIEGGHVSRAKKEGAVLISCALLLMRNSLMYGAHFSFFKNELKKRLWSVEDREIKMNYSR